MICWTSFFNKFRILLLAICLAGCAASAEKGGGGPAAGSIGSRGRLIAVLPFENLSAESVPLAGLRQALIEHLRSRGLNVMDEADLRAFMARRRLRYTGGLDRGTALAFREVGVDRVLIGSLTLYRDADPPLFGMACRLVATGQAPVIAWADSVAMAGDEAPGLLGLGLVHKIGVLQNRALRNLAASLADHLDGPLEKKKGDRTFRPRVRYRDPDFAVERPATVAILPFVNESNRRFAGDLVALRFLEDLERAGPFEVLEPGVLRRELLGLRIIIPEGASLDTADILFDRLNVDLILSGKVRIYDQDGAAGAPRVYFTVQVIDRKNLRMVWSSQSSNDGNEGVWFFGRGWVKTVDDLASRMAGEVVRQLGQPGGG